MINQISILEKKLKRTTHQQLSQRVKNEIGVRQQRRRKLDLKCLSLQNKINGFLT